MPRVIQLDESEAAEARGELIPDGSYYDVIIEDVVEKASQSAANPGKPMYQIRLRIKDDIPKAKNRAIVTTVCLWKGPHFNLIQLNKSLGLAHVDEQGQLLIPDIPELVGGQTAIQIGHGEYPLGSGEQTNNVKKFLEQKGAKKTASRASGRVPLSAPPRRPAGGRTPALESVPDAPAEKTAAEHEVEFQEKATEES